MARYFPERGAVAAMLSIAGALSSALAAAPTVDTKTPIDFESKGRFSANLTAGTLQSSDIILTQGPNTRITADLASAKGLSGDNNGEWELTGKVHIVFDNAVLDADSATVIFANDRLQKVHVRGAPSRFSHQVKDSAQLNQGRAATIDYDAQTALLRLSGDTWYSDGRNVVETAAYTYNLNDSTITGTDQVKGTIQPNNNKRVPPPRTPDRATSQ
jgi:lipopolysaccharide transport protein LptA